MNKIKVLLVDDHAVLRKGMALLLGAEDDIVIVGEAGDGEEAILKARALQPDVVVMDITMPQLNGIEATREIVAELPNSKVIALSIHSARRFVDDMLGAGAVGYLLKESVPEELLQGIHAVMRGDMFLSSATTDTVISAYLEGKSNEYSEDSLATGSEILRTKLQSPPLTSDIVPRTRLVELLEAGRNRPLTLVSAPAGYGKSILISSWLEGCDWPSVWLSLDADDSDLRQFLNYFVAAVQGEYSAICEHTLSLARSQNLPSLSTLIASLSNELEELDQPMFVVLDDYHSIEVNSPVNDLIRQLLARPPLHLHLVIISRRDPSLSLVNLRAQGQVSEIRTQDLCFTTTETRALLEKIVVFSPSEEALVKLQEEVEGWVVGLRLVSMAMRSIDDLDNFFKNLHGGVQQTLEYLFYEVLARQSAQMQEWLLKSAILDSFCRPLCDAICAAELGTEAVNFNADRFIAELSSNNLFAIPLDTQGEWFRYHHLFQQLLRQELQRRMTPVEIAGLHSRASEWFESEGLIGKKATYHALIAGNNERAGQIVERNWRSIMSQDKWYVVEMWLSQLSDSVVQARPQLLLARASIYYHQLDYAALPTVLDQIDELMGGDAEAHEFTDEVKMFRGFCAFFENDGARALEYVEQALEKHPVTGFWLRGDAEVLFGLAGQMEDQKQRVMSILITWLNDSASLDPLRETRLLLVLTYIHYIDADLASAEQYIPRQREVARAHGLENALAWCDYLEGLIHLQRGELDAAIRLLEKASQRKHFHYARAAVGTLAALIFSYQMSGQSEQAEATLKSLDQFIAAGDSPFASIAAACRARLRLMQGQSGAAFHWLKLNPLPPVGVMLFWLETPCLTRCEILMMEGTVNSLKKAEEHLQEYLAMNQAHHNACQQISILALLAMVLAKQGKTTAARSALAEALMLARPGGFIFPFLVLGQPMAELLRQLPRQNADIAFVKQVLSAFGEAKLKAETVAITSAKPGQASQLLIEPLTNREFDIMELLTQRLQNKEIAARLFISPETIKSHLKHLYSKLGVNNRREAALKAAAIISSSKLTTIDTADAD